VSARTLGAKPTRGSLLEESTVLSTKLTGSCERHSAPQVKSASANDLRNAMRRTEKRLRSITPDARTRVCSNTHIYLYSNRSVIRQASNPSLRQQLECTECANHQCLTLRLYVSASIMSIVHSMFINDSSSRSDAPPVEPHSPLVCALVERSVQLADHQSDSQLSGCVHSVKQCVSVP